MGLDNMNLEVDEMLVKLAYLRSELKLLEKDPQSTEYQQLSKDITETENKYAELLLLRVKRYY